jgi:hypothetical protein
MRTGLAPLLLLLTLWPRAAPGASGKAAPRVLVVRDQGADEVVLETANRTRAELAAARLDVTITECASFGAACVPGPAQGRAKVVTAVVTTVREGDQTVTLVQIFSPDGPPSVVRRISVDQSSPVRDDPAVLAVRAAELVFATLSQTATVSSAPGPAGPLAAPSAVADSAVGPISFDFELPDSVSPPVSGVGWFAGAGAVVLGTNAGVGMAYGGMLRAGYVGLAMPALSMAVMVAAPALSSDLQGYRGRVATRQELAVLELSYRFRVRAVFQPRLSLGAGAYHITARGIYADTGRQTGSTESWALLMTTGVGAAFVLGNDIALFADAQVLLARPYPTIQLGTGEAGAVHPSLLVALGAQRVF